MSSSIRFARIVFAFAGIYGFLVLAPGYFMEAQVGIDSPPAITHPIYYYGFIGVALAWQALFLLIASDPMRYRPVMLAGVLEKAAFGIAAVVLYGQGRLDAMMFGFSLFDMALGLLFVVAFWRTRVRPEQA